MKIVLVPVNATVGDIAGNAALIESGARMYHDADLVVFPELCLTGYPPRDLLLHSSFIERCEAEVDRLASSLADGPQTVVGTPLRHPTRSGAATNSLVVLHHGYRTARYDKRLLPTYDVFDEWRYFAPGDRPVVIEVAGEWVGLSICEDLWGGIDAGAESRYDAETDPIADLVRAGAGIVINPSASPFVAGKHDRHHTIVSAHARRHNISVLSVNQFGANDDLIFDGAALAHDASGPLDENTRWSGDALIIDTSSTRAAQRSTRNTTRETIDALTIGVRDYARKAGFLSVCLGLSGGIDSAVTAAIAARAIGGPNIIGVAMPSKYSSAHSIEDAHDLAERIGCRCFEAPIEETFGGNHDSLNRLFIEMGEPMLAETRPDVTEENLQSRIRGTIMMAVSNRTGALLLTTGNKSELAVGYGTLYGDMNGGLAVISDLLKIEVYELAKYLNDSYEQLGFTSPPIPERTITKPPSAELAPGQVDQDSLPPYDMLDDIVRRRVVLRESAGDIISATGFDANLVHEILRKIAINEYKRFQLAIGLKLSPVAFGPGRRMPLVQHLG